jgi:hypothetical protein
VSKIFPDPYAADTPAANLFFTECTAPPKTDASLVTLEICLPTHSCRCIDEKSASDQLCFLDSRLFTGPVYSMHAYFFEMGLMTSLSSPEMVCIASWVLLLVQRFLFLRYTLKTSKMSNLINIVK